MKQNTQCRLHDLGDCPAKLMPQSLPGVRVSSVRHERPPLEHSRSMRNPDARKAKSIQSSTGAPWQESNTSFVRSPALEAGDGALTESIRSKGAIPACSSS